MLAKKNLIASMLAAIFLAGCAGTANPTIADYQAQFKKAPPTTAWLEQEVQTLREKAWTDPTKYNIELFSFMKTVLEKDSSWNAQTHRLLTVDWENLGRGGAAMRQPGYIHVLAGQRSELIKIHNRKISPAANEAQVFVVSTFEAPLSGDLTPGSYSVHEFSRWERYCNHGKDMDIKDWAFMLKVGTSNVPISLQESCNPPSLGKSSPEN